MQATSSYFHGIHLLKTSIVCCLLLGSFPNYCNHQSNTKNRHQPSDMTIRHWQLTSALICQPPKKYNTCFQLETILTQPTWAAAFSFTSFLPTKIGNLTWPAGVLSNLFVSKDLVLGVLSFSITSAWTPVDDSKRWLASFPFASFPKGMEMWGR